MPVMEGMDLGEDESPSHRRSAQAMGACTISNGSSAHLGALVTASGVNFCIYSKYASRVELLLFDREDAADPSCVVELDPVHQRTYHYWHCLVAGLGGDCQER